MASIYDKHNVCVKCEIKYPDKKKILCDECGYRLRTKPHNKQHQRAKEKSNDVTEDNEVTED